MGTDRELNKQIELYSPTRSLADREPFTQLTMDLAEDASLANRWSRIHRLDAKIASAVRDVTVPGDLRGRLLENLAADKEAATSKPSANRRRFLGAAIGSISAASVLLLFGWIAWLRQSPEIHQFCEAAVQVHDTLLRSDLKPLDKDALANFPQGYQRELCIGVRTESFLGRQVRAFQFSTGGKIATVLMVPRKWFPRDATLPMTMPRSLVGKTVSCASSDDGRYVCVSIIDGEESDLYQLRNRLPIT
jgi:hypothetical protein